MEIKSTMSREKDKPNIQSGRDNKSRDPVPLPLTEEELFRSDLLDNLRTPEDELITTDVAQRKPQDGLHAGHGSFKSNLVSAADTIGTTLQSPEIQSKNPTETIMEEAFSYRPHVAPTSTLISVSTSRSGPLISNSLLSSEGGGEVKKKAPSSVITSPLFKGMTSSPEDCRGKQEEGQEEKTESDEFSTLQNQPDVNLTLIRTLKGEELNTSDGEAKSDNICALGKVKMEKQLEAVSFDMKATLLPHATDTDHADVDINNKEERLKHPDINITVFGNGDIQLYNQSSSNLISQFNSEGVTQSQAETPQHAVHAANQASGFTYKRLQAKPRPGIRGPRVRLFFFT